MVKFTQTHRPPSKNSLTPEQQAAYDQRRANAPKPNDHRAKAAAWGLEACDSIRKAADPTVVNAALAYHQTHSVRAARLAFYHAARALKYRYWDRNYFEKIGKPLDSL